MLQITLDSLQTKTEANIKVTITDEDIPSLVRSNKKNQQTADDEGDKAKRDNVDIVKTNCRLMNQLMDLQHIVIKKDQQICELQRKLMDEEIRKKE